MNSIASSPLQAAIDFSDVLEQIACDYLVGGSFASSVHGEYRSTNDIDYLSDLTPEKTDVFVQLLAPCFLVDEVAVKDAVIHKISFNIIHEPSFMKIDVFPAITDFHFEQLRRAETIKLPGSSETVRVATAEDTLLAKLIWYRKGNEVSDRQWRDIIGIVNVQGDALDSDYLMKWARICEVEDLLEAAL